MNNNKFETLKIWDLISLSESEKPIPVPYYLNTGIIINETNIEDILYVELLSAKEKYKTIEDKTTLTFYDFEKKIKTSLYNKIGEEYRKLHYAYVDKNCLAQVKEIENGSDFYQWLVS